MGLVTRCREVTTQGLSPWLRSCCGGPRRSDAGSRRGRGSAPLPQGGDVEPPRRRAAWLSRWSVSHDPPDVRQAVWLWLATAELPELPAIPLGRRAAATLPLADDAATQCWLQALRDRGANPAQLEAALPNFFAPAARSRRTLQVDVLVLRELLVWLAPQPGAAARLLRQACTTFAQRRSLSSGTHPRLAERIWAAEQLLRLGAPLRLGASLWPHLLCGCGTKKEAMDGFFLPPQVGTTRQSIALLWAVRQLMQLAPTPELAQMFLQNCWRAQRQQAHGQLNTRELQIWIWQAEQLVDIAIGAGRPGTGIKDQVAVCIVRLSQVGLSPGSQRWASDSLWRLHQQLASQQP